MGSARERRPHFHFDIEQTCELYLYQVKLNTFTPGVPAPTNKSPELLQSVNLVGLTASEVFLFGVPLCKTLITS